MRNIIVLFAFMSLGFYSANGQTYAPPADKVVPVAEYYEGGKDAMYKFINENINYPVNAKRNRIQGEVILSIDIAADGKISNAKVVKNVGGGCGDEALRVVRLLKFKSSGFSTRQNVSVYYRL